MALGLFRMMAGLARNFTVANTFGCAAILVVFLLGGFIVPKEKIKPWWTWAFWVSPLTYGQRAISVNEFTDPRWSQKSAYGDLTVGESILQSHGVPSERRWYWIGIGVLLAYSILFNIVFTLSLAYLNPPGKAQAVIATDSEENDKSSQAAPTSKPKDSKGISEGKSSKKGMTLPFQALAMTFHNVNYFVDMPKVDDLIYHTLKVEALIIELSVPADGSQPLKFDTEFPQNKLRQFKGLIEIPYVFVQTIIFGVITFFMVNYERTVGKFLLYLIFMFLTLLYFTFYGMMAVGLTPNQHLAAVISSAFYSLWNLQSGFLIPEPFIPGWWIWFYYICPVAWTLRGIITSQLGGVETIVVGPGFRGTVKEFLAVYLGYGSGMTGVSVVVLLAFSVLFFSVYAISIKVLNFQRR
ncbi:hypothetical protein Cni_G24456 [Canna indica]|uniref:ABC-2 type transporter domain-containing protein n=1 Tax=Canna indica TaxID=4628 RepID=A0AAQ3QPK9_9LILI|nr:hypothetical protein Cni_G24456 [Canna indica]